MSILSINNEIKEKDKIDGKLTDAFKFQVEGNIAKIILDFIQEGNVIRIKSFKCKEEIIDKKEYYVCYIDIVLKKKIDNKGKLSNKGCRKSNIVLKNNKLEIEKQKIKRNYDVIGDEKEKEVI
jgi:hypothetical protein